MEMHQVAVAEIVKFFEWIKAEHHAQLDQVMPNTGGQEFAYVPIEVVERWATEYFAG
jgi:hypothetical protein